MSNYTRWYRDGTLGATNGSTAVTGSGTYWKSAGLNPGDMLEVNNSGLFYEIASVNSDTSITLARAYQGSTVTGAAYAIVRNFTATMPSKIAAQTSELLRDFRKYIDTDMDRITGRSAYEIAKLHGFTGTEAEWLESLKGNAEEISEINTKLSRIYTNSAAAHNSVYRGKYLGTAITEAQIQAVRNGSFDNLYPGDYWNLPIDGKNVLAYIMELASVGHTFITVLFHCNDWVFPFNSTDDTSGGLYNSTMYNETLPELFEKIKTVIPSDYFRKFSGYEVSDAIDSSGKAIHYVYTGFDLALPSARNLGLDEPSPFRTYHAYHNELLYRWPATLYKDWVTIQNIWMTHATSNTQWAIKQQWRHFCVGTLPTTSCITTPYVRIG